MTGENERASATAEISAPELAPEVERLVAEEGWRSAAKLIEQHWDRLVVADSQHLLAAIKSLPSEALMETPHLLVAVNYLQHISTGRDPRFFHDNPQLAAGAEDGEGSVLDRLIANTGKVASLRTAGRLESALVEVERGRRILAEAPEEERAEISRSLAHFVFQWERTLDLALDADAPGFRESFELAVGTQQHALVRRSAASLAWQHADRGRLTEAARWIEVAKASDRPNPRYDAPLHLAEALVCLDHRDREGAARALAELDAVESGEYWAAEIWVRTVGTESASDAVRVEESLEREQGRHPAQLIESGANLRYVTMTRLALGLLMHYPALVPGATSMQSLPWVQLAHGFRAYLAGDGAGALDATVRVIGAEEAPRLRATALLLCAWALARHGDQAESEAAFETAHALITEEGLLSVYAVLSGADLAELVARTGLPVPEGATRMHGAAPAGDGVAAASGASGELLHLTKRERQILIALCGEQTMPEIAVANFITLNTLKATVRAVYAKLGVHSRREAVDVAFRAGLG